MRTSCHNANSDFGTRALHGGRCSLNIRCHIIIMQQLYTTSTVRRFCAVYSRQPNKDCHKYSLYHETINCRAYRTHFLRLQITPLIWLHLKYRTLKRCRQWLFDGLHVDNNTHFQVFCVQYLQDKTKQPLYFHCHGRPLCSDNEDQLGFQ